MLEVYTQRRILEQMISDLRDEDAEALRFLARSYFIHSNTYTFLSNDTNLFARSRGISESI